MTVYLDTSTLIRFFTKDNLKKAKAVKNLLEKEKKVIIPEVVFPELEYVLRKLYKAKREKITSAFKFLISYPNIKANQSIKKAVELFENTKLDMADCLIAVYSAKGKLASFDKNLLNAKGVKPYW